MKSSKEKLPESFNTFLPDQCSENFRIPNAFLEHLSKNLPKKVFLRNPHGECWPVETTENKDDFSFQEGWSRFVSDYSLQGGEFMVFKYDGRSTFDILLFDKSESKKRQVGSSAWQEESKVSANEEEAEEGEGEEEEEEDEKEEEEEKGEGEEEEEKESEGAEEEEENAYMDDAENSVKRTKLGRGGNYSFTGYHAKNLEKGITNFFPLDNPSFVTKVRKDQGRKDLVIPNDVQESGLKFSDTIMIQDPKGRLLDGKIAVWGDERLVITNFWKQLCKFNKVTKDDKNYLRVDSYPQRYLSTDQTSNHSSEQ